MGENLPSCPCQTTLVIKVTGGTSSKAHGKASLLLLRDVKATRGACLAAQLIAGRWLREDKDKLP
jgi:hypothetical protein